MRRALAGFGSVAIGLVLTCAPAGATSGLAGAAAAHHNAGVKVRSHVCTGSARSPGRLAGSFPNGVEIRGVCKVDAGPAQVKGGLTLDPNSILLADYALNHRTSQGGSSLSVSGNVTVKRDATLILGCEYESTCRDNPSGSLSSSDRIAGNLIANQALSVVVHKTTITGSVTQTGGGGGYACNYHDAYFNLIKSPIFSNYEDSTVGRGVTVSGMVSCWVGFARLRVGKDLVVKNNRVADPDAIEILSNHVAGNLACSGNSRVWDSTEDIPGGTGALYPRKAAPNTVVGKRSGQCVTATPTSQGGPAGPGAF